MRPRSLLSTDVHCIDRMTANDGQVGRGAPSYKKPWSEPAKTVVILPRFSEPFGDPCRVRRRSTALDSAVEDRLLNCEQLVPAEKDSHTNGFW